MGHEVPGMRGVYGHVSPSIRAELTAVLQERWGAALHERARLSPHSIVSSGGVCLRAQRASGWVAASWEITGSEAAGLHRSGWAPAGRRICLRATTVLRRETPAGMMQLDVRPTRQEKT
jgi:hypothetical protein